jgi:hypothetical protein
MKIYIAVTGPVGPAVSKEPNITLFTDKKKAWKFTEGKANAFVIEKELDVNIHAMFTFDDDDRTLNMTTFPSKKAADKAAAKAAKEIIADGKVEYVRCASFKGECEAKDITDAEDFVTLETYGGDFIAWTTATIPVGEKVDRDLL